MNQYKYNHTYIHGQHASYLLFYLMEIIYSINAFYMLILNKKNKEHILRIKNYQKYYIACVILCG